jgi:hypothetical protein
MSAMASWDPAAAPTALAATWDGADASPARLRLTRRGRVVIAVLAFVLAAAGVVATGSAEAGSPGRGVEVTRHVVERGETLWGLAGTVASPREDLRDVVQEIEQLNDLDGAGLRAGDMLLLPVGRD